MNQRTGSKGAETALRSCECVDTERQKDYDHRTGKKGENDHFSQGYFTVA